MEKMTDRAVALYGAGVPVDEIIDFTGMSKDAIYSRASRRGVRRPKGELDVERIEMCITEEAIREAYIYWKGVNPRHAEYWRRQQ